MNSKFLYYDGLHKIKPIVTKMKLRNFKNLWTEKQLRSFAGKLNSVASIIHTITPSWPANSIRRQAWPYLGCGKSGSFSHRPDLMSNNSTEDRGPS